MPILSLRLPCAKVAGCGIEADGTFSCNGYGQGHLDYEAGLSGPVVQVERATVASFSAYSMSASFYSPPVASVAVVPKYQWLIKRCLYCGSCPVRIDRASLLASCIFICKKLRLSLIPTEKAIVDDTAGCY